MGSAVISGGRVLRGAHGAAGEIGHISIDPAGMVCGCGGHGCVETYASETSIARRYTMAAKEAILPEEVIAKAAAGQSRRGPRLERGTGRAGDSDRHRGGAHRL